MEQPQTGTISQFPGSEQEELTVDAQQPEESTGKGMDVAKQAETNKQKLVEISESLAAIDDQEIIDACEKRLEIDKQREALNTSAAEVRDHLKELGISGPAFNAAYSRFKQDAHKRDVFDQEFAKCANAMGVNFQQSLL
jgi:hypothetical protein